MKAVGKRKASKITFKKHRKHKLLPKEEVKLMHQVTAPKPDDLTR